MFKRIYTECPQGVREVSAGVQGLSKTVQGSVQEVSKTVQKTVHGRLWTWKAQRNSQNRRTVPLWKQVIAMSALIVSLVSTLTEQEPKTQVLAYLVFGTVFFLLDPIQCITRLLAPQSCCLIALDQVLIIVGIIRPMRGYLIVMVVLITGSVTAIRFLNAEWLAAYNWVMSEAVQKALLIDVDNKATQAWQTHGRRETRTLLHELGFKATDDILDILHRPVYLCGYLNGYKKTTKVKSRIEALENKADKYIQLSKDLKAENQNLKNEISSLKEVEAELRAQLSESEYMYNNIQKMYAASQAENRRLRVANEELLQGVPEPSEMPEELSEEEQIRRLLDQNMSIRKIAEILQIPKGRIEKVKKQDQQQDDKIVIIGAAQ
ncbi:MAG: hypothetical protein MR966_09175 [Lachnospiraceae bacterium]|nr:hypothetical protein [Lachnospiraceae bacterium]